MRNKIDVTPGFCILWALLLLVLPLGLILAAAAAACVHEACHGLAIRISGGRVMRLTVGAGGMVMETAPMEPWQEIFCALAGPAGSFLLLLIYEFFPLLAACGFAQGCFNLLPLYPLDGGRAMRCGLEMLGRGKWMRRVEILTLLLLLALAFRIGPWALLAWGMLAMRKIPCKEGHFGVQ